MLFRAVVTLATAALALANPLTARQNSNTNAQIEPVLDALAINNRETLATIDTMQANNTATDGTVGTQVQNLITGFNTATSGLKAIPVSSGSNTTLPRDIDLSRVVGESLEIVATGLSGLQAQDSVPTFGNMIGQLDPTVAGFLTQLNQTLPNSLGFVRVLMLDASQFWVDEGAWTDTLAALNFTS